MDITLRQIRAFVSIARMGSFSRAAAELNLTQPTLTVQIRRLEEGLGIRLLDRTTRSVALTRVGANLLPVFERMVGDLAAAIDETKEITAMTRGVVRIAALPSVAAAVLPQAIDTFRECYPGASFVVRDVVASRVVELVRDGSVDLGITGGALGGPDLALVFRKWETFNVVLPRDHPFAGKQHVTRAELLEHPLVALQSSTSVRSVVDEWLKDAPRAPIIACEATYMMTVAGMVSAGLGIALLPASARETLAFPDLVSLPVVQPTLSREISVVTLQGRSLPPMSEGFCAHLVAMLKGWTFEVVQDDIASTAQ